MSRGEVQLFLGDCLDILPQIEAGSVDLIITSPFYNCRKKYGDFNDQLHWTDYYEFMARVLKECYHVLIPGGTIAINVPGVIRYQHEHQYRSSWWDFDKDYKTHRDGQKVLGKGRIEPLGFKLFFMMAEYDRHMREPIVWVKGSAEGNEMAMNHAMGSDNNPYLRATHELILLGSKERWHHRGGTGRRGKEAVPFPDSRKDTWYIPPCSQKDHPAPFPIEIPLRLIEIFTRQETATVLDPFMGRGTTGIACARTGRNFIGIEIEKGHFVTAEQRIEQARREGQQLGLGMT